jgi:hypothetical protein
LEESRRRVLTA